MPADLAYALWYNVERDPDTVRLRRLLAGIIQTDIMVNTDPKHKNKIPKLTDIEPTIVPPETAAERKQRMEAGRRAAAAEALKNG